MLTFPDLLLPNELAQINALMDAAEYDDGRGTARGIAVAVKSNRQVSRRWLQIAKLDEILENALRRCRPFRETLSPSAYTPAMYARYLPGDTYGPHIDAVMGGMPPIRHLHDHLPVTPRQLHRGRTLSASFWFGQAIRETPGGQRLRLPDDCHPRSAAYRIR